MEKTTTSAYPGSVSPSNESAMMRGVDQAGSTLHSTIDKVAEPVRSTVERAASAAHNTVDKLASGANSVAGKFSDQANRLTDAPLQAVDHAKAYIKDKPLQAVGFAVLAGFVLGRLTARRY
jgi:ElaB/YqjD/DUF883 family membrane-anchored ribosome-binding protein